MRQKLSKMLGFTMIELLVVIAIIGVLAVAVLSAINPIEQINKGRDTRARSDAGELLAASERYFSTSEQWPWNSNVTTPVAPFVAYTPVANVADPFNSDGELNWLQVLENSNEVKESFARRIYNTYQDKIGAGIADTNNQFVVLKDDQSDLVRVCFRPASQQFRLEAIYKCCAADSDENLCADAAATNLKGSTPASMGPSANAFTLCPSTVGVDSAASAFYICLP